MAVMAATGAMVVVMGVMEAMAEVVEVMAQGLEWAWEAVQESRVENHYTSACKPRLDPPSNYWNRWWGLLQE